jgi:hypothetical protein
MAQGTQPNHKVTSRDNVYKPVPPSVVNKIVADSKAKAKKAVEKRKLDEKKPAYMRSKD